MIDPTSTAPSLLVDLYVRLSIDKEGKDSLERQEADLRAWADREGLVVRRVWRDRGKSGYKASVKRPDFDAAVAAVTSGEVAALAVWKLDRLSRRGAGQVGTVLDDVTAVGGRLHFLKDGLDSSVSNSRMLIVMLSELARAESTNTSLRVRAKKEASRREGKYLGGARPFGWLVTDGQKLRRHPDEAPIVREAVERLLAGETMNAICRDWNARGIPTRRRGSHWRASTLSAAMRSPVLSGLVPERRVEADSGYWGTDIRPWKHPDTGESVSLLAEGESPIATEGERMALLRELDSRLRRYGRGMRAVKQPESLLGGLVECASCGRTANSFGGSYRCRRWHEIGEPCTAPLNVSLGTLELAVKHAWARGLAALEPDDPVLWAVADRWLAKNDPAPMQERDELTKQLATLRARVKDVDNDRYVRGSLSADRHAALARTLEAHIAEVTHQLAALPKPDADLAALLDPELSIPAIESASALEARVLLRLAIDRVIVEPAPYPGARFHAHKRMRIVWANESSMDDSSAAK
ncbi:recombinase family protein [Salinibacterium hongtaonis]|uniref:recombinase family protein n=1 Tax=Homoserinimonas hongtaonis TaxID=2079791 RepID=UPI000D3D3458|nr:recombinase family protein [Salinibacterium hongtaonis]AWB88756.1 hypothetical protein C2138_03610 [Salinibacterium hongtaonis]